MKIKYLLIAMLFLIPMVSGTPFLIENNLVSTYDVVHYWSLDVGSKNSTDVFDDVGEWNLTGWNTGSDVPWHNGTGISGEGLSTWETSNDMFTYRANVTTPLIANGTFSFWMKYDSDNALDDFAVFGGDSFEWSFVLDPTQSILFSNDEAYIQDYDNFTFVDNVSGDWANFVQVQGVNETWFYVNGELVYYFADNTGTWIWDESDVLNPQSFYMFLFSGVYGNDSFSKIEFDEVTIHNKALSSTEVLSFYDAYTSAPPTPTNSSDFTNYSSTINGTTTQDFDVYPEEGTIADFEVETSWADSVSWFLDGVFQKIGNSWRMFIGVNDAGVNYIVSANASNSTDDSILYWDLEVQNKFPLNVYGISPISGTYDVSIYSTCFINDSEYWFKNSTFDFQLYYNNGTSSAWRDVAQNSTSATFPIFVEQIPNQQNVQVRCRSYDGYDAGDWSSISTNLTINHPKNKLAIKDLTGSYKKTIIEPLSFETECFIDEDITTLQVSNVFVDCNNDGLWDNMKKFYTETHDANFIYSCYYDEPGIKEMTTGCVYQKTDEDAQWNIPSCNNLPYTEEYCVYSKTIKNMIYTPGESIK